MSIKSITRASLYGLVVASMATGLVMDLATSMAMAATNPVTASYGVWARGDGDARVRIAPCGKSICATNLWIRDPASSEKVGDVLVMTVKEEGGALKGTAYDRQRNLNLSFEMTVAPNALTTRGCVLGGVICKSVAWSRVSG